MATTAELLERTKTALANVRKAGKAAKENSWHVAGAAGHEVIGYTSLAFASWLSGYYKQGLSLWGVELRIVGGLALQAIGLGAMLMGWKGGRFAVSIGRGGVGSWLAERSYVRGAMMAVPADQRQPGAAYSVRGELPETPGFGAPAAPRSDVVLTRTTRF